VKEWVVIIAAITNRIRIVLQDFIVRFRVVIEECEMNMF